MKKILIVCVLAMFANVASAQTKACCKGKKACTKTAAAEKASSSDLEMDATSVASAMAEAEILAENTPDVEKKVCSESGKVSFVQKSVCEKSGTVSYDDVQYDTDSKTFVKAASSTIEVLEGEPVIKAVDGAKKACSKSDMKKCAKSSSTNL